MIKVRRWPNQPEAKFARCRWVEPVQHSRRSARQTEKRRLVIGRWGYHLDCLFISVGRVCLFDRRHQSGRTDDRRIDDGFVDGIERGKLMVKRRQNSFFGRKGVLSNPWSTFASLSLWHCNSYPQMTVIAGMRSPPMTSNKERAWFCAYHMLLCSLIDPVAGLSRDA